MLFYLNCTPYPYKQLYTLRVRAGILTGNCTEIINAAETEDGGRGEGKSLVGRRDEVQFTAAGDTKI